MYTANVHSRKKNYACYLYMCLSGKLIKKGFGLNELLNIHNSAKVVNVKEPEAGMWTVKVLLFYNVCLLFYVDVGMFYKVCTIGLLISSFAIMESAFTKKQIHSAFVDLLII